MMSCYDAALSYDFHTDTFRARYVLMICMVDTYRLKNLFLQILKTGHVAGTHHTVDEPWCWRMACNGTGWGHRLLTPLRMTCTPLTACMSSGPATTSRFSGEGTKNSHTVCSRATQQATLAFNALMLILSDSGWGVFFFNQWIVCSHSCTSMHVWQAGGMELLGTWSHVMEANTFVGAILVVRISPRKQKNKKNSYSLNWLVITEAGVCTSAFGGHDHAHRV